MRKILVMSIAALALAVTTFETRVFCESLGAVASSQASILPYLELSIPDTGQSELRFGNIQPSLTRTTEIGPMSIKIEITSNIGQQYQVTQTIDGALTNAAGDEIESDLLSFTTYSEEPLGSSITALTVVTANSPQVIYTSDTNGTGNTIRADYILSVPAAQAPGDYAAHITFTVSAL